MIVRASRGVVAIVILGLSACSATPTDSNAPPTSLPRRAWLPTDAPRAVILAVHGFNDYSKAFTEFGGFAAKRGVAVHAYDQSGFGANPDAGRWPGVPRLVADLRREHARLARLYPDRPLYLLGESMGAAVVTAALTGERPLPVAGAIFTAPAVWGGDQLNPFYRATLWVVSRLLPALQLTGKDLGIMASDNLEVLRDLANDPLFIKETRVDAIAGLVELMDLAVARAPDLPGPLLVLGGARDEVVPPKAHAAMVERLTADPCTEVIYPDGYHLLLRDLQRQVVWEDILAWIEGRALPSGLARPCGALRVAAATPG